MTIAVVWILNGVLSTLVVAWIVGMLLAAIRAPGDGASAWLRAAPRSLGAASRLSGSSRPGRISAARLSSNHAAAPDLAQRVKVLEAKDQIRQLMADYVRARDFNEGSVAEYFTADAVWEGTGSLAAVLGRHVGRAAIARRFAGSVPPALHLLTNESILVAGDRAAGRWTYLQPTVLSGRAHWVVARYCNDFGRSNGMRRLRHVRIEPIFQASHEDGWAAEPFFSNGHGQGGVSP